MSTKETSLHNEGQQQRLVPCDPSPPPEDYSAGPSTSGGGEGGERREDEESRTFPRGGDVRPLLGRDHKLRGSFWKGRGIGSEKKRVTWNTHVQAREFSREQDEEDEPDVDTSDVLTWKESVQEMRKLLALAGPMAAINLIWFSRMMISLVFLGRLGKLELAGSALAIAVSNVTGFSLMFAFGACLEPVYAQAFGARKFKLMGFALQKGVVFLLCFCIPVIVLWWNAKYVLVLFRQNPEVAAVAQDYLHFYTPAIIVAAVMHPLRSFLRSQSILMPTLWCALAALALHAPTNEWLVNKQGLGVQGVALASSLTDVLFAFLLIMYTWRSGIGPRCWSWDPGTLFRHWGPLLQVVLPSCVGICLEWWCYELAIICSGLLPSPEVALSSMAILGNTSAYAYMIPLALGSAIAVRVSTELSVRRPVAAQQATALGLLLSAWIGLMMCALLVASANSWGEIFISDNQTLDDVAGAQRILGIEKVLDTIATAAFGVLRGTGRSWIGVNVNLGSFYLAGLPLALFLAFKRDLGVLGLWIGLSGAQCLCCLLGTVYVIYTNWPVATARAQEIAPESSSYNKVLESLEDCLDSEEENDGEELVPTTEDTDGKLLHFTIVDSDDDVGREQEIVRVIV